MTFEDDFFWPHSVSVRSVDTGGMGSAYGAPRSVRCEVKDEVQLVRGADGDEVVSSSQVTVPADEDIRVGALVTVWPGLPGEREATVLAVGRAENDADLGSFLVLSLT